MDLDYKFGSLHEVRVFDGEYFLGFLSLTIRSPKPKDNAEWVGQVRGSDYLVWGLNHKRVRLEFPNGQNVVVVIRSGGRAVPVIQ